MVKVWSHMVKVDHIWLRLITNGLSLITNGLRLITDR